MDNGFLQDLDASIKGFVGALVKFKTAKEKGEKDNYLPTANGLTEEAMSIAKKVMQAPLFACLFFSHACYCLFTGGCQNGRASEC